MSIFSKFFGRTIGEAAAFALGGAMRSPLEPPLVELTNETWLKFVDAGITVPTEASDAAEVAAEDKTQISWARGQAAQRGMGHAQMDKLIEISRTAPSLGELIRLRRRGIATGGKEGINLVEFKHGLRKAKLDESWDDDLAELVNERLDPAVVATAIQRGIMKDPGFLPVDPPAKTGHVKAFPVSPIDPLDEAMAAGINEARLFVETALVGNPASPQQAASAYFRGIGTIDDYHRAIAEGNTRNEWRDLILEQSREIPSATNFIEAHVRDWITEAEMYAGTAKHGMSRDDTDTLFLNHGRPLSWHQVWIGLQRGGKYQGPISDEKQVFYKALRESDIRPEWYDLAWAQRYTLPSAFVLRALTADGTFTAAQCQTILVDSGWVPAYATQAATKWAAGGGTAAKEATVSDLLTLFDGRKMTEGEARAAIVGLGYSTAEAQRKIDLVDARRVASARTAAITDMHGDFKKGKLDAPAVTRALNDLGIAGWAVPEIVEAWQRYREAESLQPPPVVPPPITP